MKDAVSYTHLDVYKRQILQHSLIQAQGFGDAYRIDRGYHESNRDGDFIEVVYNDGGHQIQA